MNLFQRLTNLWKLSALDPTRAVDLAQSMLGDSEYNSGSSQMAQIINMKSAKDKFLENNEK